MNRTTKNWIMLLLTAFVFALMVGNVIFFLGNDYLVPYIHLDLFSFVGIFGYGAAVFLVTLVFRRKK